MCDVIGIGSAVYDMLMLVDGLPQEDTKVQAKATRIQSGGPCSTAIGAASKLGLRVEYMGTIANDFLGQAMLSDFKKYGIGSNYIRVVDDCESFHSVVLINPHLSTRTCVWNQGTVPAPTEADVNLEALQKAQYLYLDGHHPLAALYAATKAKEFGVRVVLDAGGFYPGIQNLVAIADILIPSEEFALRYSAQTTAEQAAISIYGAHHPELLVITQGKRGGLLFDGKTLARYPAFEVHAIDTNGAGDVFHGAFLVAHAKRMAPMDCATFASATAALKCMQFGARESVPTYPQALEFLRASGVDVHAPA